MKQALNNIKIRAKEITRILQWGLPLHSKWQATTGTVLYHTNEIDPHSHSQAKYRYGVEIEMDFKFRGEENLQPTAIVVRNLLRTTLGKSAYSVQRDESLACGFEVVTAPLSLQLLKKLRVIFDDEDVMTCLNGNALTSGLHITVDPFQTREQERRFFDYFNSPRHIGELEQVIGRLPNRYCKLRHLRGGMRVIKDHNYAVHIRSNRAMEVRVFKSPASWETFWQRLMLTHRVNKLVRETDLPVAEIHKKIKRGIK